MPDTTEKILEALVANLSALREVESIGISGSKSPLPKPGEGDMDVFIYCDAIPSPQARKSILDGMNNCLRNSIVGALSKGYWGLGDFTLINGVETWLMFFTVIDAAVEVDTILNGEYPEKLDNYFYPVGRCAMLKNMSILYDKYGFLESMQRRLSSYPVKLASQLTEYHLDKLSDLEDMQRAVSRKDVLFYHFALDLALDHFLQALFAMNRVYFPSRKRTLEHIERFPVKPAECSKRLLEIIKSGGNSKEIARSYALWLSLIEELRGLT